MPVVGSVFEKPLDDDVYGLQNALAIIVSGDTAPSALSQGKYIYLINHSTIRSGLYKIISAISSGDTIVSTDIETVPDGIINDLIEADGTKVNKTDIVNNLTTNDSTKVLSAAQGYALNSKITNNISLLWGVPYHTGKTAGPGTTPTVVASGSKAFKKGKCLLLLEMPVTMSYGSGTIRFVIGTQTVDITVTSSINSFYIASIDIPADGTYNWSLNIIGNASGSITASAYETNALYAIEFPS